MFGVWVVSHCLVVFLTVRCFVLVAVYVFLSVFVALSDSDSVYLSIMSPSIILYLCLSLL